MISITLTWPAPLPEPGIRTEKLHMLTALKQNPFFRKFAQAMEEEQFRILGFAMEATPQSLGDFTAQEQLKGEYRGLSRLFTLLSELEQQLTQETENGTPDHDNG